MEKKLVITAENTWLEFTPRPSGPVFGPSFFDLSVAGVVDSTVTVQRKFDETVGFVNVDSFTAPTEKVGQAVSGGLYRVGVKTGEYGSDTITVIVRQ